MKDKDYEKINLRLLFLIINKDLVSIDSFFN